MYFITKDFVMRIFSKKEMSLIIQKEIYETGIELKELGWTEVTCFESNRVEALYYKGNEFIGFVANPKKDDVFENRFLMQNKSSKTFTVSLDYMHYKIKNGTLVFLPNERKTFAWVKINIFEKNCGISFTGGFRGIKFFNVGDDDEEILNHFIKDLPAGIHSINDEFNLYYNSNDNTIVSYHLEPVYDGDNDLSKAVIYDEKLMIVKFSLVKSWRNLKGFLNLRKLTSEDISHHYYSKIRAIIKEVKPGYTIVEPNLNSAFVIYNPKKTTVVFKKTK